MIKGIRVEYADEGFIHSFDNMDFDEILDDISEEAAGAARQAMEELKKVLPEPKCLESGDTGLISYFTEYGYEKFKPYIDRMRLAFEEVSEFEETEWYSYKGCKLEVTETEFDDKDIVYSDEYQFLVKGVYDKESGLWFAPVKAEVI